MARNVRRYMPVVTDGRVKLLQAARYNARRRRKEQKVKLMDDLKAQDDKK